MIKVNFHWSERACEFTTQKSGKIKNFASVFVPFGVFFVDSYIMLFYAHLYNT